jgi:hypothetical protein
LALHEANHINAKEMQFLSKVARLGNIRALSRTQ